ncbi:TetR/AcrR family transcriptional regulator [Gordonia sp. NB41Y]|uniref:TetR/AcrR family transcriptional regulator n=1 Tax=Gordonia sp. NB41Y TaxID=875808 RepID=UPI00273B701E|nr:TetR/AcrR family transcriptional regulator [Gordonia sp. NB41Y]WLP92404.1 TetR/AcrR family transcriptional regulator [Gordonia sp. NB41Y]
MAPISPLPDRADTRDMLLTVAERLFLADGYDKVSVRSICAGAGVNPAAVHYHFGSKDGLTTALIETRLAPLWADPLEAIDTSPDAGTTVADVVTVIVAPFVALHADPLGHLHLQLLARFVDDHPDATWSRPWFHLDEWATVLTALVPGLDAANARRRWALAFALLLTRFGGQRSLSAESISTLTQFVNAGLDAPADPAQPHPAQPQRRDR